MNAIDRRAFYKNCGGLAFAGLLSGCGPAPQRLGRLDKVWGRRGIVEGRFSKPRAITIDAEDRLYIVDMTARIQVFDADGEYLTGWKTPEYVTGRPTGMSVLGDRLKVADTHYFRVLSYTLEGELIKSETLGAGQGSGPGQFGWVTDIATDSTGAYFVSEYGESDRIQKFSPTGEFLLQWGAHGSAPGQFARPQSLVIDSEDHIWVADACNHRLQVFDAAGILLDDWGTEGSGLGQFYYPYGLVMDHEENLLVCEYGNARVQKISSTGVSLGAWGTQGRSPGQLWDPWAMALDSRGRLHVLDTMNHRVQRVVL